MCYASFLPRILFIALLALSAWRDPLVAQQLAAGATTRPHLRVGQPVRVGLASRGIISGNVVATPVDSLVLHPGGEERARIGVAWGEITDIWTREPAYRRGARTGAVTGTVLFGVSAAWLSWGLCDAADCAVDAGVAFAGAAVGALMGAVTGGVIGTLTDEWVRRYPE